MRRNAALLSDAVDEYLGYLKARQLATNTIKANQYLLKGALALWGNIMVKSIAGRHIDQLFGTRQWGPRTHNTNLQFLRSFLAWCRNQGYMPLHQDPTFGWRNLRVPENESLRIPVERFGELLDATEHPRDRAQLAAGLFLFIRGSELVTIRIEDLDFSRHTVSIFRHKTKQADTLPMCAELEVELNQYLNWYRQEKGELLAHWYLFPARQKTQWVLNTTTKELEPPPGLAKILPTQIQSHPYRVAQRAIAKLGYPTLREGEHTLRRSGARAYADALRSQGYDGALLRVASMLGHKDTKQTEHYIGWNLERSQRNEALAGKHMFGDMFAQPKTGSVLPFAR